MSIDRVDEKVNEQARGNERADKKASEQRRSRYERSVERESQGVLSGRFRRVRRMCQQVKGEHNWAVSDHSTGRLGVFDKEYDKLAVSHSSYMS